MPAARFSVLCLLAALVGAAVSSAQSAAGDHRLEILLEKRDQQQWRVAEPGEVLEQGNEVRFRLTSNLDGRLFAYNRAPDGEARLIFPNAESETDNRISSGREFLLPEDGSFGIDGPPGHEVIYWVVSPEDERGAPRPNFSASWTDAASCPPASIPPVTTRYSGLAVSVRTSVPALSSFALPNSSELPDGLQAPLDRDPSR